MTWDEDANAKEAVVNPQHQANIEIVESTSIACKKGSRY
jgi:hypothetical protein